ncbi:MAG: tyrosine-protein phosphatase [Parachlamydiales bacterium]
MAATINTPYHLDSGTAQSPINRFGDNKAYPFNQIVVQEANSTLLAINASYIPAKAFTDPNSILEKSKGLFDEKGLRILKEHYETMAEWETWATDKRPKKVPDYIATQGPYSNTSETFWKMAWEHKVPLILCLVEEKEVGTQTKEHTCHPYFPLNKNDTLEFGEFEVEVKKEPLEKAGIATRILTLARNNEKREIIHLWHTQWADKTAISKEQMGQLLQVMAQHRKEGPVVVHCGAGLGRTGAVIASDLVQSNPGLTGGQAIQVLRSFRGAMVRRKEQQELVAQFERKAEAPPPKPETKPITKKPSFFSKFFN